jgi:hypothetical protein
MWPTEQPRSPCPPPPRAYTHESSPTVMHPAGAFTQRIHAHRTKLCNESTCVKCNSSNRHQHMLARYEHVRALSDSLYPVHTAHTVQVTPKTLCGMPTHTSGLPFSGLPSKARPSHWSQVQDHPKTLRQGESMLAALPHAVYARSTQHSTQHNGGMLMCNCIISSAHPAAAIPVAYTTQRRGTCSSFHNGNSVQQRHVSKTCSVFDADCATQVVSCLSSALHSPT